MVSAFAAIPEEVIEHILSLVLAPPPPRTAWQPYGRRLTTPSSPPPVPRTFARSSSRLAVLLVSHQFLRIATPLYYRNITLRNAHQTGLLSGLFKEQPQLATFVRNIVLEGVFAELRETLHLCTSLEDLDLVLEDASDEDLQPFCESIDSIQDLKKLTVRQKGYLTLPAVGAIFEHLAEGVQRWSNLDSVNIAFRFSPIVAPGTSALTATTPAVAAARGSAAMSSTSAFTAALAHAPKLRSIHAELPTLWNPALLDVSANPSVQAIHLTTPTPSQSASLTTTSSLYLSEARKHPRLIELIKAGTTIGRGRAWTTVPSRAPSSHSSPMAGAKPSIIPISSRPPTSIPTPSVPLPTSVSAPALPAPSSSFGQRRHSRHGSQQLRVVIAMPDTKGVHIASPTYGKGKGRKSLSAV